MRTSMYLRVSSNTELPASDGMENYKAVVIAEEEISWDKQLQISRWLVDSGCMYLMAWGVNSSSWDDSVDCANIEKYEGKEIPEESLVITTWHDDESLDEVFNFAKNFASHPVHKLDKVLLLHVSSQVNANLEKQYDGA